MFLNQEEWHKDSKGQVQTTDLFKTTVEVI